MTGFGRGNAGDGERTLSIQLTSVNRKTLEVTTSLPKEWQPLEALITAKVRDRIARGRVHVAIEIGMAASGTGLPVWDEPGVLAALAQLKQLAAKAGVAFEPNAELLLSVANTLKNDHQGFEAEHAAPLLEAALSEALESLVTMREREGAAMARDFADRIHGLRGIVERIRIQSANTVPNYRENLLQRLRQAGLELDLGDERVLKEIALFADRCDISEELTRLDSHLAQFSELLEKEESIGRKAEFILQEIGREVHTIGSKANDIDVARLVIDFKNELERVREQVQNIE